MYFRLFTTSAPCLNCVQNILAVFLNSSRRNFLTEFPGNFFSKVAEYVVNLPSISPNMTQRYIFSCNSTKAEVMGKSLFVKELSQRNDHECAKCVFEK